VEEEARRVQWGWGVTAMKGTKKEEVEESPKMAE
jgi:hypothetical protein